MSRLVSCLFCCSVLALAACSDEPDPGGADASHRDAAADQPDADPNQPDASSVVADCQFDSGVQWTLLGEVVQAASADGSVCAVFERRNDCPPDWICLAVPFTILEARIGAAGVVHTQTDADNLHWEGTHHNWSDWAEVKVDGVLYRLDYTFGQPGYYTLSASDLASGNPLWGPVQLDPIDPV